MVGAGCIGIEAEIKLIFPAKLKACFGECIISQLSAGMTLGQVRGVSGNLIGDGAHFDVIFIWQAQMLFGCDITEHGAAIPSNHGCSNARGNVIVARSNVSG